MNKMEAKEKIIEELEGKRTEQIWDLIVKSVREVFEEKIPDKDLEMARKEYLEIESSINNKENKYLMFEHYNLDDGFFYRFYGKESISKGISKKQLFIDFLEDYFEQATNEDIMIIDLEKKECYLVGKKVEYTHQLVEIK